MATDRSIDNVGFRGGLFSPPTNLGKAHDSSYELTAYSRIWGLDADGVSPKSYKVNANVAVMGRWVFLSVDECLHPMHALTRPKNTPAEKQAYPIGQPWYEYQWAKTDGVWKDEEIDAFPDRIYFDEMLPKEILEAGRVASQHAIPIAEYQAKFDYYTEDKWYVNPGVVDSTGKLVISNIGEMEIWGNYDWVVDKNTKYLDESGKQQTRRENFMAVTHGFNTHWPSSNYSKPLKQAADEDYYVGFHSFSLVFKLNGFSYAQEISEGYRDANDVPDKENSNKITKCGQDLEKLGNYWLEKINTGDSATIQEQKQRLKTLRIKAHIYKTVQEIKKAVSDQATRSRLLKEIKEAYPIESAEIISLADVQMGADDGGMCVVPNDNGMEADD